MASEWLGGGGEPSQAPSSDEEDYHSAPEDSAHVTEPKELPERGEDPVGAEVNKEGVVGDSPFDQEGGGAREEKVELTEEQIKELKERAGEAKKQGNDHFKNGDYGSAIDSYTQALELYPRRSCDQAEESGDQPKGPCDHERAVCYANRAACHMKKESHQDVIDDCSEALTLEPHYLKALLRRAQSYEAVEKYEDALEDYKKVLEIDGSQLVARQAMVYLPDKIKEQHEKLKTEMLGKLKELGNAILNPFGLSTENFQLQQDPNSGGYSINFKR